MQHGENRAALARAERAGRGTPRRRSALGPPPAVVGPARQPERRTRGGDAQPRADLGDRCHHAGSVVTGVPSNAATCFCRATTAPADLPRLLGELLVARIDDPPRGPPRLRRPGQLAPLPP